jgi:hypothetical protein
MMRAPNDTEVPHTSPCRLRLAATFAFALLLLLVPMSSRSAAEQQVRVEPKEGKVLSKTDKSLHGAAHPAPLTGLTPPKSGENATNGEAESSRKATVDWIQSKYAEINHKSRILRHIRKDLEGFTTEGGTLESFSEKGQVVKLTVKYFGETFRVTEEYYYADGQLIFMFSKVEQYSGDFGPVADSRVDRLYFHQRRLIQWLAQGRESANEGDQNFKKQEKSTLEDSDKYLLWAKDKRGTIPSNN